MRKLDKQEHEIVKALIVNPRCSDNAMSKLTGVPLKTVNRKRKAMEQEGLLYYLCMLDNGPEGTGTFSAKKLYIVKLRKGITRKGFLEKVQHEKNDAHKMKHLLEMHVGESDGQVTLVYILESRLESDIVEIFNADIVPEINSWYNSDVIDAVQVISLNGLIRILHNYLPLQNLQQGRIRKEWPENLVFVD